MEEICPQCGSLDCIPDFEDITMLICLDCGHKFLAKVVHAEDLEECPEDEQNPYDPNECDPDAEQENSDLEEIEEEWIR